MSELGMKRQSFVERMTASDEHAWHGFEILAKQPDADVFFDALREKGLFKPEHNPGPVPAGDNLFQIPWWGALQYLVACAKLSGSRDDMALADKVLDVVRSVSAYRDANGAIRDNYHTFREFAEILGLVPLKAIRPTDIDLIATWLSSRYDRDGVASALDKGALRRLLSSDDPADWTKAVAIIRQCTVVEWVPGSSDGFGHEKPITPIDAYWLNDLLSHHAEAFGKRVGAESADVLTKAVTEAFGRGPQASWSYIFRPAVEEHGQNSASDSVGGCFVKGLRDVLLAWTDTGPESAKKAVANLLRSEVEMVRRIGIYLLNEKWPSLGDLYLDVVGPDLFSIGHIHELHNLLSARFESFDAAQKEATLAAIRSLSVHVEGDDSGARLTQLQLRWMSSLSASTYESASTWLAELKAKAEFGVSDHPDFNTYSETLWGPGPSPISIQDLVAFTEAGSIVEKLVSFKGRTEFRGPTAEGLAESLGNAVEAAPALFLDKLPLFLDVPANYQNVLIQRFKRLWETSQGTTSSVEWDRAWSQLADFFERLVRQKAERRVRGTFDASDQWIEPSIADFLRAGSSDEHPYPAALLNRAWQIIESVIDRTAGTASGDQNPMDQAINTPKGRMIEALFSHVLRECRIADASHNTHEDAWALRRPLFDRELAKCSGGNFEFSTLCGAYVANLDYMAPEWLRENIHKIFPKDQATNFYAAIGGLTYGGSSRRLYVLLRDEGILDQAVALDLSGRDMRKQFIERIGLGYLWNEDDLDSPRFKYLFEHSRIDDFEILCFFFRQVRRQELSPEQITRVVDFWERCVTWAGRQATMPRKLLSRLSDLAPYLDNVAGRNATLLEAVAPYVGTEHGAYEFFEELRRLLETQPSEAALIDRILQRVIDASTPSYDYRDALRSLVKKLAELDRKTSALDYCDRLRRLPGMTSLFKELTRWPQTSG